MPGTLTGKVVAVTGASGFIGAQLVERLADHSCTIVRVSRSPARPLPHRRATIVDVIGDVAARDTWNRIADADVIFHLAAQTSVAVAEENADRDFDANVAPMRHLLAACRERNRRPMVVFAGTVTEAGLPRSLPVNEDAPDDPITTYDRHKLMAERDLEDAAARGDVFGATLRLANVYGPGAHGRRADRDVLNRMIGVALSGHALTLYGSGEQLRDYIYIDDVVEAFMLAALHAEGVSGRHFVIGSGCGTRIRDAFALVAERVARSTGRRVDVTPVMPPVPLGDIDRRDFVADHAKFSALTGWRPGIRLAEGIDRTIEALACAS